MLAAQVYQIFGLVAADVQQTGVRFLRQHLFLSGLGRSPGFKLVVSVKPAVSLAGQEWLFGGLGDGGLLQFQIGRRMTESQTSAHVKFS